MEVHHHTHHPKKWKEYFWEFFMLFLAVFCGFLAEYQLEHKIENDREKKYIASLINDLIKDSVEAGNWLEKNEKRVKINDTLLKQYGNDFSKPEYGAKLYLYFLKSTSLPQFDPHTATMNQLKSSGSLRLIHDQRIIDEILNYDQQTIFLQKINAAYGETYRDAWMAAYPVLHVNLYFDSAYANYNTKIITTETFPPIKCSPEHLDNFFGAITRQQIFTRQEVGLLRKQITAANKLVGLLKKSYDLD